MAQTVTITSVSIGTGHPSSTIYQLSVPTGNISINGYTLTPTTCTKAELEAGVTCEVDNDTASYVIVTATNSLCANSATIDYWKNEPTPTPTPTPTPVCTNETLYRSTISANDAYCNGEARTVYHNAATFADATEVYGGDSTCSTLAGAVWFSDQSTTVWYWSGTSLTEVSPPGPSWQCE